MTDVKRSAAFTLAQNLAQGHARPNWKHAGHAARIAYYIGHDMGKIETSRTAAAKQIRKFLKFLGPCPVADITALPRAINGPAAPAARTRDGPNGPIAMASPLAVGLSIASSIQAAEFGVRQATPTFATRSGWFSDRTECLLASGEAGPLQARVLDGASAEWRRAAGLSGPRPRRWRIDPHQQRLRAPPRRAVRDSHHEHYRRSGAVLPRLLDRRPAHQRPAPPSLMSGGGHDHSNCRQSRDRVESMTLAFLTEGLVARGHQRSRRCFATADSTTSGHTVANSYAPRLLHDGRICGPGSCIEMLNLAAAVATRRAEFDIHSLRGRVLTRCRLRSPGCRRPDRPDAAPFAERPVRGGRCVALPEAAVCAPSPNEQASCWPGPNRSFRHGAARRSTPTGFAL